MSKEEIDIRIKNITKMFDFKNIDRPINKLTLDEKQTVALMSALIINPKILVLDEAFTYISKSCSKKILNILKKINITIISVTHDAEELLLSDNIIILKEGKIIINDKKEKVFESDLLDNYPFIIDLSNKLKYYELVDKISYSYKELVNEVWK